MARNDNFKNDGRAFGYQHFVSKVFGFAFKISNRTSATLSAIEAEFVVIGWATFCVFEAVGQQQQSAIERDCLNLLAPEFVSDANGCKARILNTHFQIAQQYFGQSPKFIPGETA